MKRHRLPVHRDPRGTLIPLELSDLPFAPSRVFIVSESSGAIRGDHLVPCRQTIVLARGGVTVTTGLDLESRTEVLSDPGDAVDLDPGEYVRYRLADETSTIIVFADRPYGRVSEPA